ncbi:MAG: metal ABC transporter substrate-binding protein [Candidatus Tisiphia sp.]
MVKIKKKMKINISASIFIAIIMILLSQVSFANVGRIKIVTSITTLASIIAMLVKEQAEIVAIANNNDCPHHYNLRPSDLKKVKDADIVFYIDEQFDGFAGKLMNGHSKNVIKISNFNRLKIINNDSYSNWHIWLDLDNVKILLDISDISRTIS